jgi:hypothetical protein
MTTPSLTDAALTAGGKIGRNFSVVTMVPTLLLVLWAYALLISDAWSGTPDLAALRADLGEWAIAEGLWLVLATTVLALFLHPFQFATVQLLEGYWGVSRIAVGAMRWRVRHHRQRLHDLADRARAQQDAIDEVTTGVAAADLDHFLDIRHGNRASPHVVARDVFEARRRRYPVGRRVMPTRLGNMLRHYEDAAGAQYGLEAIITAPHFALVLPAAHLDYLRDSRQLLDTAVRLCSVSLFATLLTVSATLTDGLWLLVALVPYGMAYLAYRAAIAGAEEYGTAVATVIDLDRFLLYESLGLPKPNDTTEERQTNADLVRLLHGDRTKVLRYASAPEVTEEQRPPGGAWLGTGLVARLFRRRGA